MKQWRRGLVWLLTVVIMWGAVPFPSMALINVSENEWLSTKKIPTGKTGKTMTVSFTVKNSSGDDWTKVKVGFSESVDISDDEESIKNGYIFPFEVEQGIFNTHDIGSIKHGSERSATLSAKVRRDIPEGYYSIPIKLSGESGVALGDEYINIWISKSPATTDSDDSKEKAVNFVLGEGQNTPYGTYPNVMDFAVNMRNSSAVTAFDVTVAIVLSEDSTKYPFEINDANYNRTFERVGQGETVELTYSMAIRKESYTGYYPIKVNITFRESMEGDLQKIEKEFFVNVVSKPKPEETKNKEWNANTSKKARIIVDGFTTTPKDIYAGDAFELVLRMKNASSDIPATNIVFSIESEKVSDSAVFSTESGSSSYVVNNLAAGESKEIRLELLSKAGVDQRSYALTINQQYDSPEFTNATEKVVINIPVKQKARLNTGTIEVMPDSIIVGSETNVMFPINNTGKIILYNVMAKFESDSIQTVESYVGNIKPGESKNVDVMLTGSASTVDSGKVNIIISYEDENGEVSTENKIMTLMVNEEIPKDLDDSMMEDVNALPQGNGGFFQTYKNLLIAAAVLVLLAIGGGVIAVRKKRKRAAEEKELNDEIS